MTTEEFNREFDILYNNIMSNQAPGLNLYEKSLFLTQAQEDIVKELYSGSSTSFESAELVSAGLGVLIKTLKLSPMKNPSYAITIDSEYFPAKFVSFKEENNKIWYHYEGIEELDDFYTIGIPNTDDTLYSKDGREVEGLINSVYTYSDESLKNSTIFVLPEKPSKIWYLLYEGAYISTNDCRNGNLVKVKPIKLDDLHEVINNPFVFPNSGRTILRVAGNSLELSRTNELISKDNIESYVIKYLRKPNPIILCNLSNFSNDLKIDGVSVKTDCELNESLHRPILRRAVALAQSAWGSK